LPKDPQPISSLPRLAVSDGLRTSEGISVQDLAESPEVAIEGEDLVHPVLQRQGNQMGVVDQVPLHPGFSQNLFRDGRIVIRGGYGLSHATLTGNDREPVPNIGTQTFGGYRALSYVLGPNNNSSPNITATCRASIKGPTSPSGAGGAASSALSLGLGIPEKVCRRLHVESVLPGSIA
jgi:hypothetical protein